MTASKRYVAKQEALKMPGRRWHSACDGGMPFLDFGLCTLCAALGRAIGWIGHAIEEYQADTLIRPRARYTGLPPSGSK